MDANDGYPIGEPLISIQKKQQGGNIADNFRAEHPSVRDLKTDLLNKKIQEHYSKNAPTNTIQKDNTNTVKPKVGNIATQKEINQRAEKENKTAYENSTKQANKDYVEKNMGEVYQHPLWSLPGTVTPEGVAVMAMQGAAKITPDLYNKDYKSAGMDALMMLPLAPGAVKAISPVIKNAGRTLGTEDLVNNLGNKYLPNAYKLNPLAEKLNTKTSSYRIAGMDSYEDFLNSGVVRSKNIIPENATVMERINKRPTSFPSFQKGYADTRYLPDNGGVIYETSVPTFKRGEVNPITQEIIKGRHYAHRPIDMSTGQVITELPAKDVRVFNSSPNWLTGFKEMQEGGIINDNEKAFLEELKTLPVSKYGMYEFPNQKVIVPSSDITMKNIPHKILGISLETGEKKMMLPEKEYKFANTKNVLEIPKK
jgi:hypothetical protein